MIDFVKKFFSGSSQKSMGQSDERVHDIRVATCALLLEMSRIDGDFSAEERDGIIRIMTDDFALSPDIAQSLLDAADDELRGSRDLWEFTSLINKHYSMEEKMQIIETVWRIAYTDRRLDQHEDALAHKLADLLRLTHRQMIDAKLRVMESMGIDRTAR